VVTEYHYAAASEISQKGEVAPDAQMFGTNTSIVCSIADPSPSKEDIRKFDFGFLPIPNYLRHDSTNPFHFTLALNIFFGLASTLSGYCLFVSTEPYNLHASMLQLWAICIIASLFLVRLILLTNGLELTLVQFASLNRLTSRMRT
jgi:hypothetical protein